MSVVVVVVMVVVVMVMTTFCKFKGIYYIQSEQYHDEIYSNSRWTFRAVFSASFRNATKCCLIQDDTVASLWVFCDTELCTKRRQNLSFWPVETTRMSFSIIFDLFFRKKMTKNNYWKGLLLQEIHRTTTWSNPTDWGRENIETAEAVSTAFHREIMFSFIDILYAIWTKRLRYYILQSRVRDRFIRLSCPVNSVNFTFTHKHKHTHTHAHSHEELHRYEIVWSKQNDHCPIYMILSRRSTHPS